MSITRLCRSSIDQIVSLTSAVYVEGLAGDALRTRVYEVWEFVYYDFSGSSSLIITHRYLVNIQL